MQKLAIHQEKENSSVSTNKEEDVIIVQNYDERD